MSNRDALSILIWPTIVDKKIQHKFSDCEEDALTTVASVSVYCILMCDNSVRFLDIN